MSNFRITVPLVFASLVTLATSAFCAQPNPSALRAAAESNVNSQYLVESVLIEGVDVDHVHQIRLPSGLKRSLLSLIGAPCDMTIIADLAGALRNELHLEAVSERLLRGSQPDRIRVNFEPVHRDAAVEVSVPRFIYHSTQGWTAQLDAKGRLRNNELSVGFGSNGDDLTERFTGLIARFERPAAFSGRLRIALGFEDYREQWSAETRKAATGFELYSERRNLAPELRFAITRNLAISGGASFEQIGAKAANSVTAGVRFGKATEGDSSQRQIEVKYRVRVATADLGSDYAYTRQLASASYSRRSGAHSFSIELQAGAIAGRAPMFERFVLGNSSTLRGWDRYQLDPLGGNRMAHNSVRYGHQLGEGTAEVVYDAGAVWESGGPVQLRHSVGICYRQGIFTVALALPVTKRHTAPVFMAGMNY